MAIETRNGVIRLRYSVGGKRKSLTIGPDTPGNHTLAQAKEAEIVASIRAGTYAKPAQAMSVHECARKWLEGYTPFIAPTTAEEYTKDIQALESIMEMDVSAVTAAHIQEIVARLVGKGLTRRRIRNILTPIRGIFDHAVDLGLIDQSPVRLTKRMRASGARSGDAADPYSHEELRALMAAGESWEANLVQFWAFTGLRPSEMYALTRDCVDLHSVPRPTIHVSQARVRGALKGTKNESSTRAVELLPPAIEALTAQMRLSDGLFGEWDDRSFRNQVWHPLCDKAQVRYRGPKHLRHTFASMMLMAGEPELWVAKQMGHTNTTMLREKYARWITSERSDAGNRAVSAWGSTPADVVPIKRGRT